MAKMYLPFLMPILVISLIHPFFAGSKLGNIKTLLSTLNLVLILLVAPCLADTKGAALQMTSTLEDSNTSLQYNYAANLGDGRGITFGCIGFCTGTYDGNILIKYYTTLNPNNILAKYIPALDVIDAGPHNSAGGDGNPSTVGLNGFIDNVHNCNDTLFYEAQFYELDQMYWNPAVSIANNTGTKYNLTLAFIYDMCVRHGADNAQDIVDQATSQSTGNPGTGVNETTYLATLINIRDSVLRSEGLGDRDRDIGFKNVLNSGNVNLITPFTFVAYGDSFNITGDLGYLNDNSSSVTPVANFTSNVTSGYAPLTVQFNDSSTNATGWKWDFGDGTNSTQQNTTHVYTAAGNFTVNLTVSNANGTSSKSATINISVVPVFPGYTNPPTDPSNDGLYEDINGNGHLDFDDVVAYYDNMEWIGQKGLTAYFDYNKNGSIDFDDVVKLYDMI